MNNSIPRSVIFGFLSWLLPFALTFAATPIIVRHLGAAEYGIYVLVLGFISYTFAFNIGRAVTKYVAEYHAIGRFDRINEVLSATLLLNLAVGSIGAVILLALTNNLVTDILQIETDLQVKALTAFYVGAVTLAFWMIGQVFSSILQALGRFDSFSQITFATSAVQTIGNVTLAWSDYGVVALLTWNLFTIVLSGIVFFFAGQRLLPEFRLNVLPSREVFSLVGRFSGGIVAYQIIANLLLIFERTWVTRQLGAESLTYYTVPMMLSFYIHHVVGSLTLVLFPMTSELTTLKNKSALLALYRRTTKYVCLMVAFMGVTLAVSSREFLSLWLGADFSQRSSWVFVFHVSTYSLFAILIVAWQMIEGYGLPFYNAIFNTVSFVICVSLMITLVAPMGITGAAIGRFASALPIPIFIFLVERRMFGNVLWGFWRQTVLKLGIAGFVCALTQYFILSKLTHGWTALILSGIIGGLIFLTSLLVSNFLDEEERRWFGGFMKRAIAARA
ncbi:MAG: oligosaccharide flippase family protein [Acidobacteriota bacterium]|nr:oligosaccharide flippase family protein [Acidobacteriota bacterium]